MSLGLTVGGEEAGRTLADTLPAPAADDPAELVVSAERIRALQRHLDAVLSDLEVDVLRLFVEGRSYVEIAEHLHRQVKAIDNAIQRVRRKIELHLRERELAEAG
ncbi:MAG: sigma factor-like helix-turn-helix DNA-binding protein, partial [Mycobacteriales bacterium]